MSFGKMWRGIGALALAFGLLLSNVSPALIVRAHGPGSTNAFRTGPVAPPILPTGPQQPAPIPQPAVTTKVSGEEFSKPIDLKFLVISADGLEPGLAAITNSLEYVGAPYTVVKVRQQPGWMVRSNLTDETKGFYQAVILTTGSLVYHDLVSGLWPSALSDAEWQVLWTYERDFGVRQATWYTYPNADFGYGTPNPLNGSDSGVNGITATLTTAGVNSVFKYMNPKAVVKITYSWTYQAQTVTTDTIPVLVDAGGNSLVSIRNYPDGRQNIAMTFDSNQYQTHNQLLNYGVINWVAKGLFLGERHVFLAAQNDDILIPDDLWDPKVLTTTNAIYRMTGDDLRNLAKWQGTVNTHPTTQFVKMQYAFNGIGSTTEYEPSASALPIATKSPLLALLYALLKPLGTQNNSLTAALRQNQSSFMFINHTWDHTNLDATTYAETLAELKQNIDQARMMGFSNFSPKNLVTPDVSGLRNTEALRAMVAAGVKNMVSDTSRPGENNPFPNVGNPNWTYPNDLYMIARYPTNLFYNVGTPTEWASEYNFLYRNYWATQGWTRDMTYGEILDKESDVLLGYLISGNINPIMFHQTNTRFYDGVHSTQTDLLDRLFQKYDALYNIPILSLQMDDIGTRMRDRGTFRNSGVTATYTPSTKKITISTKTAAVVPVTGLQTANLTEELYASQYISHVSLNANQSITLTATNRGTTSGAGAIAGNQRTISTDDEDSCDDEGCEEYEDEQDPCDYEEDEDYNTADAAEYFEIVVPAVITQ